MIRGNLYLKRGAKLSRKTTAGKAFRENRDQAGQQIRRQI
jgi:hypothetical protein